MQMGRPSLSSGIMGTPSLMRQMSPSQPGNANVIKSEDIRSQYDRLKKEAADRRAGGFMGQVVLPTEGQTFEEYKKGRDKFGSLLPSGVTPRGGFNRDPMNNLFSQPSFPSSDPVRREYDRLKKEAADRRANGFMGRVVLPTENQTFEEYRDERKNSMASFSGQPPLKTNQPQPDFSPMRPPHSGSHLPNNSMTADFGMIKPNFNQSAFDDFMGGLTPDQKNLINTYGYNQRYQENQRYFNSGFQPNMGMGIGSQRPTGMGMFGGFPQRPPQRPQGIMGGFGMFRPQQPMNYSGYGGMQRPMNYSGYRGMQRPQPMMNYSGYGMQRPQQNYGMQQPMNYSGYGQQPMQSPYQQYGMQGGGYQQSPYQQPYPQPQQYGGYGMSQGYGGQSSFAPMSNPYQPQQYGNSNNFSGYGQQPAQQFY